MKISKEQLSFVERFAAQAIDAGVPPSFGKVMAYLMICQPHEQSAEAMQTALGLSVGSVNTALNTLIHTSVVERITKPGDRRYYYRFDESSVESMVARKMQAITRAREVIDEGRKLPGADSRLDAIRTIYIAFENQVERVMADIASQSQNK